MFLKKMFGPRKSMKTMCMVVLYASRDNDISCITTIGNTILQLSGDQNIKMYVIV